jgi:hypothetical protein
MNEIDMCHLMVDLETLGTQSNSVILSIGIVKFNLSGNFEAVFNKKIDIQSCLNCGLQVDGNTIEWWLGQNDENIKQLVGVDKCSISNVLYSLEKMFSFEDNWCVWSHGSNFDIVLLENAYKATKQKIWWNYKNVRDTRTLFDIVNYTYKAIGKHDALEDAMCQAKAVCEAYKKLKGG